MNKFDICKFLKKYNHYNKQLLQFLPQLVAIFTTNQIKKSTTSQIAVLLLNFYLSRDLLLRTKRLNYFTSQVSPLFKRSSMHLYLPVAICSSIWSS